MVSYHIIISKPKDHDFTFLSVCYMPHPSHPYICGEVSLHAVFCTLPGVQLTTLYRNVRSFTQADSLQRYVTPASDDTIRRGRNRHRNLILETWDLI